MEDVSEILTSTKSQQKINVDSIPWMRNGTGNSFIVLLQCETKSYFHFLTTSQAKAQMNAVRFNSYVDNAVSKQAVTIYAS